MAQVLDFIGDVCTVSKQRDYPPHLDDTGSHLLSKGIAPYAGSPYLAPMRAIWTLLFCLLCTGLVTGQICTGSLGANIFERGDFGSGTAAILATDPGIAPGYQYANGLPGDGFYTITSNTAALAGLYPTWLRVGDSSSDPDGYYMVINASFSPGAFYEEEVDDLCESTLYEFSADIINLIRSSATDHGDPNVDFLIDGQVVYSTGQIAKTNAWAKFGFAFETLPGQTDLVLTLRNNAPGGLGNDLGLDNIAFRPCGPSSFVGIDADTTTFLCIDDAPLTIFADLDTGSGMRPSLQWQSSSDGLIWADIPGSTGDEIVHTSFTPGDYYYRYVSAGSVVDIQNTKCRVISDIVQITVVPEEYNVIDTICQDLAYELGTQILTLSGSYTETFLSSKGCDSIVYLDLAVVPEGVLDLAVTTTDPSCEGTTDGQIADISVGGGYGSPYTWDLAGVGVMLGNYTGLGADTYVLSAEDRHGCSALFDIELLPPIPLAIDLGADVELRLGDALEIVPTFSGNYDDISWSSPGSIDCATCPSITTFPFSSGLVIAEITSLAGCRARDTLAVTVAEVSAPVLANIFSPNGDNINDEWNLTYYGSSISSIQSLVIADRWGNIVAQQSERPADSGMTLWDGTTRGSIASQGVYAYQISLRSIDGRLLTSTGTVSLLR